MKKTLIIIGCVVIFVAVAFGAAKLILGNQSDATYYDLKSGDQIASIKEIVGRRNIVSLETTTSGGVLTKIIEYKLDTADLSEAEADLGQYLNYLVTQEGFEGARGNQASVIYRDGSNVQLVKDSVEEGKAIVLTVDYGSAGYTLTFTKAKIK